MSTTVDERVVEMRFDNKHFESNVATSMSTLDKLKQKLNLSGASKGLEDIDKASKKVNMSGLGGAVESVSAKFSALQVIGVTALANITNSAVNAGKRIVSALTIDPVMSGFREYETQINSVQTILANTSSKGTTIDDVTAALDELNKYADLTIYNFTEMTRNIGTFTAAGIDLDTSVNAIQGIANLAAVSGSTSQQASVAMYQLSQALASGTVKLMDWNSVVNAGMGGEVFQNALKETSRLLGTGADAAIEASGSFRESLSKGWLTAEVLTETLKKFTTSGANEYVAEYTGLSVDAVEAALDNAKAQYGEAEAIEKAAEALANKSGKNKDEIKSVLQMAQTATDAATKVKTFSQLWDVMKEAAQSGWAKTWQIIIGDFEEAKALLTPLSDFFTGVINKMSDWRNNLLESALGKGFVSLGEKITGVLKPAQKAVETVSKVTSAITDLDGIVNKVIRGDFGNGADRVNALTEAGINYYRVQNKVNETLNNGFRYTDEQIEAQDKLLGIQQETVETTKSGTEATVEITDAQKDQIKNLIKLSDAELKAKGYTDEQIEAFRELRNTAEKLGIPLNEFIDNIDEINGRWLLINSFKNVGKALLQVFKSIGEAWRGIFKPIQANQIFDVIAAVHKFTASLIPSEDAAKNLTRTFKGLFAVLDIVRTILGGGIRIVFKVLSSILSAFDLNILDVTASIGDLLVAFRDWLLNDNAIAKVINSLIGKLPNLIKHFKEWFAVFKETPAVQKFVKAIESIKEAFAKLKSGEFNLSEFASNLGKGLANAIKSLPGMALQIGKDFITGFQNGIGDSIRGVIKKIIDFCTNFIQNFASALGVHSPSVIAYSIAVFFISGFMNGLKSASGGVIEFFKGFAEGVINVFKSLWDFLTDENGNIDWNKIFAGGSLLALILVLKKLSDVFGAFAGILGSVQGLIGQASLTLKSFGKVLNGVAWDLKAEALKKMAISIAILVASIWLLTRIDDVGKLWNAVGVIAVLAVILIGLAFAMDKLSAASIKWNKGPQIEGIKSGLLQIGIVILLVAAAVKMIGSMNPQEAEQGFKALAGIAVGMLVFMAALGGISRYSGDIKDAGKMMKSMAIAMLLMIIVCKMAGNLSAEQMLKGALFAGGFVGFVAALVAVTKISSDKTIAKVSGMLIGISFAMTLMVGVCKLAALLSVGDMLKGALFAGGFVGLVAALVAVTKISDTQKMAKINALVLSVSFSLLMLVGVCKLVGLLSVEEMVKGGAFVFAFLGLIAGLVSILKISNKQKMAEVSKTIIAMSFGIAVLAGVCVLLSFLDVKSLAKGITAVGMLSLMMSLMVHSLKGAKNAKDAMKWMSVSIIAMAGAVAALSFIDDKNLAKAVGSMVALMGMFALMMKSLKGLTKVPAAPIIIMIGVIVALAGVMYLLGELDPKSTMSTVASLAILMLAMAGVLKILNGMDSDIGKAFEGALSLSTMVIPLFLFVQILKEMTGLNASIKNVAALIILISAMAGLVKLLDLMSVNATKAIEGIVALSLMVAPLLLFVYALKKMNGVEDAVTNVKALAILMTVLTLLLIPLTIVGSLIWPAILGIVALTAMAVPMLIFIAIIKRINGIENASSNIELLLGLMSTMTELLVKIALVGPLALIGVVAMTGLVALMGVLGIMATAIGRLMTKFPNIQKFLDTGLPILEQLAESIGTMIGKFVSGITGGIGSSLVKMGEDIAEFMDKLSIASSNASKIKSGSFDGVKDLMGTLLAIGGTAVGTSITDIFSSLFSGQTSMEKFETDSVAFFNAMKQIGKASSDVNIDKESFDSIVAAAQSLANLQSSIEPIGGLMDVLVGRDDLASFGDTIVPFIRSMKQAFKVINGVTVDQEAFDTVIDAATRLQDLQKAVEPIGGIVSIFKGRDDLASFGETIVPFIESMKLAFSTLKGMTLDTEAFDTLINASERLQKLQEAVEPIGGVITWFKGKDDLGTFGKNIAAFVESMKTAFSTLDGVTLDSAALDSMILATEKLAPLQDSIESIGGIGDLFKGRDDLGAFGKSIIPFAEGMKKLSECGAIDSTTVGSLVSAATKLSELQGSLDRVGGIWDFFAGEKDLETFGIGINAFAIGMKSLSECGTINIDTLTNIVNAAHIISEFQSDLERIGGIGELFVGSKDLSSFGNGIYSLANGLKKISEVGTIDTVAFDSIITAATKLSELQGELDRVGGVAAFFAGDNDLATFGKNVVAFMDNMKAALSAISGLTVDETAFEAINTAATKLSELQGELDRVGGVAAFFAGDNDLATFGENVASFMTGMKKALSALDGITLNSDSFEAVKTAVGDLSDLQKELTRTGGVYEFFIGKNDLGTFGQNVALFADGMMKLEQCEGFDENVIGSIKSSAEKLKELTPVLDPSVKGIVSWVTNNLSADYLGDFGTNIGLFADGMIKLQQCEGFNSETLSSISTSAEDLQALIPKMDVSVKGIVSWVTNNLSADYLGNFGTNIGLFADGMIKLQQCQGFNSEVIESIGQAATDLKDLIPKMDVSVNGIISWVSDYLTEERLGTFGTNIGLFADGMLKLKDCGNIQKTDIDSITNAGTAINELQKALPTEYWFDGKMDLSEFSDYIDDFGTAMSDFGSKASEINSTAVSTVISTAYRIKNLITSLVDLDTSGVEDFTGIGTGGIGADGPAYDIAKAIAKFGEEASEIDNAKVSSVISSAQRLKSFINSLSGLDASGIANFKPKDIGEEMKKYSDKVSDIDNKVVSSSITSASRLKNFIGGLSGLDTRGINNFKIGSIGSSLKSYASSVSSFNVKAVSTSIIAANRLRSFIVSLAELNSNGVNSFKNAIDQLSTVNIGNFVKAFSGASGKLSTVGVDIIKGLINGIESRIPQLKIVASNLATSMNKSIKSKISIFSSSGQELATKLANGFSSKNKSVTSVISSSLSSATTAIRNKYTSFYSAGSYLVTGFSNGISENSYKAAAKAKAMAEAAIKAARNALKINSPSKVFKEIGSGIPEGFAIGIGMLGGTVKNSVTDMASTAIKSTRSAMATVLDALNSDMDAQPTIRPVIDLTDVRSGASAINGMLSGTQGIGVQANLNAINVAMNRKLQNGNNDDIISAINKLNDNLEGTRGDTYNFAGITYDNGDEISNAVQTLVRAAKMGRRV